MSTVWKNVAVEGDPYTVPPGVELVRYGAHATPSTLAAIGQPEAWIEIKVAPAQQLRVTNSLTDGVDPAPGRQKILQAWTSDGVEVPTPLPVPADPLPVPPAHDPALARLARSYDERDDPGGVERMMAEGILAQGAASADFAITYRGESEARRVMMAASTEALRAPAAVTSRLIGDDRAIASQRAIADALALQARVSSDPSDRLAALHIWSAVLGEDAGTTTKIEVRISDARKATAAFLDDYPAPRLGGG